ncbi:MAG: type II toxin-antitoxin system RelE/ParE family toxin [Nitrospirae bacterium]|nr:type II toxin-antitoxin system RelE/ParE family toxin [Nitrospirota bacterium]
MSLRVVFRVAARIEFEEAITWYDGQRQGLGEEFLREIDEVILRAAEKPERFPFILSDVRKAVARRFSYSVFFRVRGASLVILAVFHGRRDPTVWRRRA